MALIFGLMARICGLMALMFDLGARSRKWLNEYKKERFRV